jgi:hypothetical protein
VQAVFHRARHSSLKTCRNKTATKQNLDLAIIGRYHGEDWQTPFRKKLDRELLQRDLMFLMGTLHRFPEQWLIVSLIYPPKRLQQSLL